MEKDERIILRVDRDLYDALERWRRSVARARGAPEISRSEAVRLLLRQALTPVAQTPGVDSDLW